VSRILIYISPPSCQHINTRTKCLPDCRGASIATLRNWPETFPACNFLQRKAFSKYMRTILGNGGLITGHTANIGNSLSDQIPSTLPVQAFVTQFLPNRRTHWKLWNKWL